MERYLVDSMKKRHTVRSYSERPVDDELLNELLETAVRASNTGNMQAYSVIVTRSAEMKKKIAPLHFNQPQVTSAPVVLTFCADFNRFSKWCLQRKAKPGFANVQAFAYSAIDAVILAQTFCVAAEEKGLGICYLGTTTYNASQISEALELPELVFPVTTVSVGFPDESAEAGPSDRLPLYGIIHNEIYKDYIEKDIDEIYGDKESLPENRHFVDINDKETLAQVFTDLRYTKNDNEHFSDELIKALRGQGFLK